MKLAELKTEIGKYQYFEDTQVIDVALAAIVATRLKLGDPIWMIIIGASSGGKSQILRPLALTDPKFLHRIDDLTENTFLSGMNLGKGAGDPSLLTRVGKLGILVMSDLTVLFSKAKEARATILSQFRMIYDGEMVKFSGTSDKAITWKGALGVLAGSTPSIYAHFEEVADMGERFIYYRMKDYSAEAGARLALARKKFGRELDDELAGMYEEYIKEVVQGHIERRVEAQKGDKAGEDGDNAVHAPAGEQELPPEMFERIVSISMFAEKVRTVSHMDWKGDVIDRIPVAAMPMRVALQLMALARGLAALRAFEGEPIGERDFSIIDWCGYSLANEEKRACLRVLACGAWGGQVSTQAVADAIGLGTTVTNKILQNMAATGVLVRAGRDAGLYWSIKDEGDWAIVRRCEGLVGFETMAERALSSEESDEMNEAANASFDGMGRTE